MRRTNLDGKHLVLWDGHCGFCRNAIEWCGRQDRRNALRFLPYQECPSPPMTPELAGQAARAVQVITLDGVRLSAGRASLFVLSQVGWRPRLVSLLERKPFVWVVELGYRLVARNRNRVSRLFFRSPESS